MRSTSACLRIAAFLLAAILLPAMLHANENGGSVYPIGAETVLPAMIPPAHQTTFIEFTLFYEANRLNNSAGQSAAPEFKVRVFANAVKLVHNWGVPVFGGKLNSNIAVPTIYEQLHVGQSDSSKSGLSNVIIGLFQVGYQKNALHWFYEGDLYTPGAPYVSTDTLNIGQNNFAAAPIGGFTYLPRQARWEVSSKLEYIVNFRDAATHYNSGNEFTCEYVAMRQITPRTVVGVNGYVYKQTTNDTQNGLIVGTGNRGRDFAIGPELRIPVGKHSVLALKYFRDTLVLNRPQGNAFWFEMGVPLSFSRNREAAANRAAQAAPPGQ
jgi:hypothetical protein